jgi:curved DNA-binding protein CbpA
LTVVAAAYAWTSSARTLLPEAATPTYYELLGVSFSASHEEVRDAYRQRALHLHPDRRRDASPEQARAAAREMREINDAWRVLGDPTLRAAYDADLARAERENREPVLPPVDGSDIDFVVDAADEAWSPGPPRGLVAQYLPVALLLLGLVLIVVVTAYAR